METDLLGDRDTARSSGVPSQGKKEKVNLF